MAINFPDYDNIVKKTRADVKNILSELDPTIFASFIGAITDSNSGRHFDNVLLLKQLAKELFPDTASFSSLQRWADLEEITPFGASPSQGNFIATGSAGVLISSDSKLTDSNSNQYNVDSDITTTTNIIPITSISRSGSTVTVVTSIPHNFASGNTPTIAGAVETDYNGTFTITVTDESTFTYTISATPSTPATGTITATLISAKVSITSVDSGSDKNLDPGAELKFISPPIGIDISNYVDYAGLSGGAEVETKANLYSRVKQSRGNPVANFNSAAIERAALSVAGVTRVKVKRITPDVGSVTILFVRDDDDNIIPTAAQVADVKNAILELLPATSDENDVIVTAPTPVTTNFTFSAISPDTFTMRKAVEANILAMYIDEVTFEQSITEDKYRSAIINTIDPDTGNFLTSFTLISPAGDISISTDEIAIPGIISF